MAYIIDEKTGDYKRTVSCGYCYKLGHNQGSCEKRKEDSANSIAEYEKQLKEDNFNDDWDRDWTQRQLDRHKAVIERSSNRGKNRKCSYCTGGGHTRRTCKKKKGDMNDYATRTLDAREKFINRFAEHGLGPGALVTIKNWNKDILALIDEIRWDFLTHEVAAGENREYLEIIISESNGGRRHSSSLPLAIADINESNSTRRPSNLKIISPVDSSYPGDFLTMDSCYRAADKCGSFEKARPYQYYNVNYDDE